MNAAMLIRVDGQLVGLNCAKGITLPGGKVEEGETYREAAIRECLEETGIMIGKAKLVFQGFSNNKCYCYTYEALAYVIYNQIGMDHGSGVVGLYSPTDFLKSRYAAYYDALFQILGIIE